MKMTKRTGPTNQSTVLLINSLKKESNIQKTDLWRRIAEDLEKPSRRRREVNLSRINRFTKPQEVVIVSGKVLGSGMLDHGVVVAAFAFSSSSRQKIEAAKGKIMSIAELVRQNPKGKDVRILG